MNRHKTFEAWLSEMQLIIASPNPRKAMNPLRILSSGLHTFCYDKQVTSSQLEDLLQNLTELRGSRCNGRLECERDILHTLNGMCRRWVFIDNSLDVDNQLLPDFETPSEADLAEHLRMFGLLANHSHQLLGLKPLKLQDYNCLMAEACNLLEMLTWRPELKDLLEKCLNLCLEHFSKADPPFAHRAVVFIDKFHYRFSKNHSIPESILKQLEELSKRTKNESTAFAINELFVDLGRISEFAALDAMGEFRNGTNDW